MIPTNQSTITINKDLMSIFSYDDNIKTRVINFQSDGKSKAQITRHGFNDLAH